MDYNKLLGIIAVFWIVVCLYFVVMGGRNKRKPKPRFEKVPIIVGILVSGLLLLLMLIGAFYFDLL